MPKPIYTFLRGTQLIHAKADLRFTQQKYNNFFNTQVFFLLLKINAYFCMVKALLTYYE